MQSRCRCAADTVHPREENHQAEIKELTSQGKVPAEVDVSKDPKKFMQARMCTSLLVFMAPVCRLCTRTELMLGRHLFRAHGRGRCAN